MRLRHGRVELELHELSRAAGPALLLLHSLGGSSADWPGVPSFWQGSVYALDFSGHGESAHARGGAYLAEYLLGDADVALAEVGTAALAGAGIGAYVALLLAGARPAAVPATLLVPGNGLNGGGSVPDPMRFEALAAMDRGPSEAVHDPMVLSMAVGIRPPGYVAPFARAASKLVMLDDGGERPEWWLEARRSSGAETVIELAAGLARLHELASGTT